MRFITFLSVFIWKERRKGNKYTHQQREKEVVRVRLGLGLVVLHQDELISKFQHFLFIYVILLRLIN